VGIVHCAVAPAEPRDLLHLADEAMYEAKRGEKCTVVVYRRDVAEADPARIA
jgi:GGDEF domain-containing protein